MGGFTSLRKLTDPSLQLSGLNPDPETRIFGLRGMLSKKMFI